MTDLQLLTVTYRNANIQTRTVICVLLRIIKFESNSTRYLHHYVSVKDSSSMAAVSVLSDRTLHLINTNKLFIG